MPSSNGVYSLPPGYLAVTGSTILASQHNPIFEDVAQALTLRLSRDGSAPMTGPINLAAGTATAPSLIFTGNVGTGIYPTTAGLGVAIGGVKVAEFLAGGVVGARFLGELIPYTCTVAPALTVLPVGQTLSRTTYAALWAQAQIEIAAGNTFYNNGDGSTTFGIGDMRGRVPVGWDVMGGTAANRVTTAGSGINGAVMGTAGGLQNATLLTANLPPYTPAGGNNASTVTTPGQQTGTLNPGGSIVFPTFTNGVPVGFAGAAAAQLFVGTPQGGTSTPFGIMQPTLICNYLLFAGA